MPKLYEISPKEAPGKPHIVLPKVSIVIPCFNCSKGISETLENVLSQDYPDFEVLILDANSSDRTMEVVKSFYDSRVRIYAVASYHRYEMLNKGISLAKGMYLNFLFPGDVYLQVTTLQFIMTLALEKRSPNLIYGASLLRDGKADIKMIYRPFSLEVLKRGQQPTSLQACWFRADTFSTLGKFHSPLEVRGAFDFLIRFSLKSDLTTASTSHVVTDIDMRGISTSVVLRHMRETGRVLVKHFGFWVFLRWFFQQRDFRRLVHFWFRHLRRGCEKIRT